MQRFPGWQIGRTSLCNRYSGVFRVLCCISAVRTHNIENIDEPKWDSLNSTLFSKFLILILYKTV